MLGDTAGRVRHAFTVDLEEWFHGIELRREDWPRESRLDVGMERLLALLDAHGVRGTFFVLGVIAEQRPRMVAELDAAGHEVGCHGYAHEFVYRQTRSEFRDDLRRARDRIGDALGRAPRGFRAPYFSVRSDSLWALDVLAEEGFAYDSSVFPVRNDRYGIPNAPRAPYDLELVTGTLREVPMTVARVLGANLPFSGGAYLRILPWWVQSLAWSRAELSGQSVIIYVHPWELDPEHPRIALRRRVAATHYARLGVTQRRLDRLLASRCFGRLDELVGMA